MPISMSRNGASEAWFVWSVDSTRCPVSAAWTAISAVSRSRISPIMMISGSYRTMDRRPLPKVRPAFSFTCTWVMPASRYSTGSSTEMILSPSRFTSFRAA